MTIDISICPTSMEFADGSRYDEDMLIERFREFIESRHPGATITTLQIGRRQGDEWATVDGDSEVGDDLVTAFFEAHGQDDDIWEEAE